MKSATTLNLGYENKWYATRPHAFQMQDAYAERMMRSFIFTMSVLFIAISAYTIQLLTLDTEVKIQRENPVIIVDPLIPPPPPVEPVKPTDPDQNLGGGETTPLKPGENSTIKNTITRDIDVTVKTVLADVISGLPTPTTAPGQEPNSLFATVGNPNLRVDNNGSSMPNNLGIGRDVGFATSPGSDIVGPGRNTGLPGISLQPLTMSSSGPKVLRIDPRFTAMKVAAGGRSSAEIEATVRTLSGPIMLVYRQARSGDPSLSGKIVAEIFIQPDGTVRNARVIQKSVNNMILENGMLTVLRRTTFSAIQSTMIQRVEIPYTFSADE